MQVNVNELGDLFSVYGLKALAALAIFFLGKWAVKSATSLVKRMMRRAAVDETLVSFGGNVVYGLGLAFIVIAALSQLGVETTSLAAIFAAAGLAIGLALQGSLSNLASGVLIVMFRPFVVGDFIEAAGTSGVVEEVSIFTTTMRTGDNKTVIVPNGSVIGGVITNYSKKETRRIDMVFGIGYDDDIKKAKQTIEKVLKAEKRILEDPAPVVAVSELADSSVNFVVRPWVNTADYWAVKFDITEEIKLAFDKAGITIPYPQRDLRIVTGGMVEAEKPEKAEKKATKKAA